MAFLFRSSLGHKDNLARESDSKSCTSCSFGCSRQLPSNGGLIEATRVVMCLTYGFGASTVNSIHLGEFVIHQALVPSPMG